MVTLAAAIAVITRLTGPRVEHWKITADHDSYPMPDALVKHLPLSSQDPQLLATTIRHIRISA